MMSQRFITALIVFAFSAISGCAEFSGPDLKHSLVHDQEKLILVNFHSDKSLNALETAQDYTYSRQKWQRPNHVNRLMQQVERDYLLTEVDEWPIESLELYCVVYVIDSNEPVENVLEKINLDTRVAFAEPLVNFQLMQSEIGGRPTTQSTSKQIVLSDPLLDIQHPDAYLLLEKLHGLAKGNDVRVGIVDSGIDTNHPDLTGQIHNKQSFINSGMSQSLEHGTAVAGIIGAAAGNQEGITGLVPDAELYSYEACGVLNNATFCDSFTLAKALEHALQDKIQVLNLSLAGRETPLLRALIDKILASGTILIAAENNDPKSNFPADVDGVIAVGLDMASELWFANQEQLSTQAGGGYRFFYGTSMSAAGVTGFSTIMLSIYQPQQVVTILKSLPVNDCGDVLSQITFDAREAMSYLCSHDTKVSHTGSYQF